LTLPALSGISSITRGRRGSARIGLSLRTYALPRPVKFAARSAFSANGVTGGAPGRLFSSRHCHVSIARVRTMSCSRMTCSGTIAAA
jgi:hypothetical protein